MMMAGNSINAMTATMWPPYCSDCISKKDTEATKVTALTDP